MFEKNQSHITDLQRTQFRSNKFNAKQSVHHIQNTLIKYHIRRVFMVLFKVAGVRAFAVVFISKLSLRFHEYKISKFLQI